MKTPRNSFLTYVNSLEEFSRSRMSKVNDDSGPSDNNNPPQDIPTPFIETIPKEVSLLPIFPHKIAELILEFAENCDTKYPRCIYLLSLTCKKLNNIFHETIKGARYDVIKELIKVDGNRPMEMKKLQMLYEQQWCPIWKKLRRSFRNYLRDLNFHVGPYGGNNGKIAVFWRGERSNLFSRNTSYDLLFTFPFKRQCYYDLTQ
jgi:hypothetical protein